MGPATASLHMLGSMQKTLSILAVLHFSLAAAESLQDGAEFDYIIVGGGAAGEILASRLSENPNIMVALLEAGEEPDLNMEPNNFPKVSQGGDRYGFSTYQDGFSAQYIQDENVRVIAEEFTGGATPWVHMMHLRGHPNDYQGWADAAGDNSWNYENMLKYFTRSEQVNDKRTLESSVTGYGTEGTLNLTRESSDTNSKIIQAFEELGYEYHLNLNATLGITEPFYYMSEGQYQSIYQSYIVPARNRSNLFIYPKTTATLIRFDDDQTATGVQAYNAEETYVEVRARQEIILAGGVIRTPQLMLLSGIGPAADLNDWGISVVSDLPVGEGMSDRVGAIVALKLKESNDSTQISNDYMAPTTVAFKALDSSEDTPDYQATNHIFPRNSESLPKLCVDSYQYKAEICEKLLEINSKHELMFSVVSITRPQSTGFMALNSLDMFDDPFIYMGYFAETADLENLAASLRDFSNIVNFSGLRAELVDLGLAECGSLQQNSQEYWMCYGQYMSTTTWNVVGTAQMGDVLDSKLNVRGVQKLRVVGSSAIPFAHSGYLLPSIIVVAEKAADLILGNVEISNLVTDVSEENFLASEEGSSVSEESSLASEEKTSNNSDENEDSPRSENEAIPSSENESTTLSKDEEDASAFEENSSPSDENASAQRSNDSDTESSIEVQENASAQETNDLGEDSSHSENQGTPSSGNETASSSEDKQGSQASDENASAQRSNDLDEESSLDSRGNVSAQGTNNSNENEDSPQSENEANSSSEDKAALLSEDEDGASEENSSASEENASAQETNDIGEDSSRSETQGTPSSGNETASSSEDKQGSSASDENASAQGSNDLDEEISLDSQGNVSAQGTNNSNENEDSPQSENEANSSSEDKAAPLSEDEDGASEENSSASEENASAQETNDISEDSSRSETQGTPSSGNETASSPEDKQGSSASDENASAQGSNDLDEESSLDSQGNVSAQGTNNSNENEDSPQSENEANSSSEDKAAPLSEDEDGASEENSSASEENASTQETNDIGEDSSRSETQGTPSSGNETASSPEDKQGSSASDENASAQGSNDLDEESSLDSRGNVSAQGTNNSNENEDSPQSENEANSSSEDKAAPLSEDEDGTSEENSSASEGNASAQETNDIGEDSSRSETQGTPSSGNETASSSEDKQGSSVSDENASTQGSNDLDEENALDSQGNVSAQGTNNSNENEDSLQSENEANSSSENKAAPLSEDEDGASEESSAASEENASAQRSNDSAKPALEGSEAAGLESGGEAAPTSENEESLPPSEMDSSRSEDNLSARRENDSDDIETPIESDDVNTTVTNDETESALGAKDADFSGSEGETQSEDDVFVRSSNNSTSEDETTSLSLSANSMLNVLKIRAAARLLRSMGKSVADGEVESLESDEAASLASEIVANSTLEVDEETESQLISDLVGRSDSESVNDTFSIGGLFGSESETEANSTFNALNIRSVVRLLESMGKFAADEVDESLESDEAASLASEIVANSTLDVGEETKSELIGVLIAHLLKGSDSELKNEFEAVSGLSGSDSERTGHDVAGQAAENETNSTSETQANSTLDALKYGAVAWLLGSMGSSGSDEEESVLESEDTEDIEEAKSGLAAVLAVHLLGGSESTTGAIRGLFGRSESETEASNGWFGSDSESDEATGLFGSGTTNNDDEKETSNFGRHYLRMRMLSGR